REMQTTSRYASRTSASLGEGYSFIALRFGTCMSSVLKWERNEKWQDFYNGVRSHLGLDETL
ncbi:MAG: hypothetical protein E7G86_03230, partial [Prevotella bivia]|nr:hypothetical protein [Prevotella bivia]